MANGTIAKSTHTALLPQQHLPDETRQGHVLPSLTKPLLSIGKFCDAGFQAIFDASTVVISDPKTTATLLTGRRSTNGLWEIPISPTPTHPPSAHFTIHDTTMRQAVRYLHLCLFSPTKSTWLQAIRNNHFVGWPSLTANSVQRHLQTTVPTLMGHMDQQRQNTRSTTKPTKQNKTPPVQPSNRFAALTPTEDDIKPNDIQDPETSALLSLEKSDLNQRTHTAFLSIEDLPTATVYSDQTGQFPITSSRGTKAVMVVYDYDSRAILVEGISSRGQSELLRAYQTLHQRLTTAGLKPIVQRLDNEASQVFKKFLQSQAIDYQLTPATVHRRNAAERAIRTWKNHFISGLSSTNPKFPLMYWCQLLPQSELTLNLLRTSRLHPHLSSYAHLFGAFDFNRTPLAPPGCEVIAFKPPTDRTSWDPHGDKGWYIGPAMEHYRCYKIINPATHRTRVVDTVHFMPHNFSMPTLSSADLAARAALDLSRALLHPSNSAPILPPTHQLSAELQRLSDIFTRATQPESPPIANLAALSPTCPRVRTPIVQTKHVAHCLPVPALSHSAHGVYDETTGRTLEYRKLIAHDKYKDKWRHSSANEFGRLAQGVGTRVTGTNTIKFVTKSDIPTGRSITYGKFVCELKPHKQEKERTRLTVGGNLVDYPGNASSPTADLTTLKIHLNSVISTPNAKMVCWDIENFYLNTPLDRPEYMKLPLSLIPDEIIRQYDLKNLADTAGWVYIEINKGMYGLPQSGKLANDLLRTRLSPHGFCPCPHTPGLWTHATKPISFVLVVDDFAVKYVHKDDADHLLAILQSHYTVKTDWAASTFCGIHLHWDYPNRRVHLSMPGYIDTFLDELPHKRPIRAQHSPYAALPILYGKENQLTPIAPTSPNLQAADKLWIQKILGKLLYYARAVDSTLNVALSALAAEQAHPTETTRARIKHLLDYCATHPAARLTYTASDMQLVVHSDAGYNNETQARSRTGGHFFLGMHAHKPPLFNGAILNPTTILKHVASSAADCEVGAAFHNCKEAIPVRLTLTEMGFPQAPTQVILDNTTAIGFIHDSIKQRRTKAMDMRYWWLKDRETQKQFKFVWRPSADNLADYFTKHHPAKHHQNVRPRYLSHHVSHTTCAASHCEGVLIPRSHPAPARTQHTPDVPSFTVADRCRPFPAVCVTRQPHVPNAYNS